MPPEGAVSGSTAPAVTPVETPAPHRSKEQQVADLLAGKSSPPAEPVETPALEESKPAEKWDVKALAERLQVDPATLYEQLEVPLADGTALKLGELKDRLKAQAEADTEREKFVSERGNWQADQIRSRRELEALVAALPEQASSPQLHQTIRRMMAEQVSREQEALFRKVPEWTDGKVLAADRKVMEQHLAKHGFGAAELDQVQDHRLLAYFRRQALAERDLAVETQPRDKAPKVGVGVRGGAPPTAAQKLGRVKAAVTQGTMRPASAVEQILKGL